MGEANKDGFVQNNTLNFLQRFKPQNPEFSDLEQPDINLGLTLGGCYTQIPEENPLIRTSSLNGDSIQNENEGGAGGDLPIERSASVPTQAEQELRKLKEMQAMKRMEAKRRLMEKHRQRGGGSEEEKARMAAKSNWAVESAVKNPGTTGFSRPVKKLKSNVSPPPNLIIQGPQNSTAAKAHTVSPPTRAIENGKSVDPANYRSKPMVNLGTMANGKLAYPANYHPAPAIAMEKTANEKTINLTNSRHPDSAVSFRKRANGKPVEPAKTEQERPSKKVKVFPNGIHDIMTMEMMKLMPSVTTTGDGPNGRKIEGLLYKYTKGHVSIVCVCHGTFLSPAEFVKHAGGGDVENPMKRINVLPAAL